MGKKTEKRKNISLKIFSSILLSLSLLVFAGVLRVNIVNAQTLCADNPGMCDGNCCKNFCYPDTYVICPGCCEGTCVSCGGPSCFPAGTKVSLQNGSTKNIEDIKVGDKVISEDTNGKQSISTVASLEQPVSDNLCEIKYTDGESLKVTKGHPLFTQNGWKAIDMNEASKEDPGVPVSTLKVGDFMKKITGSWAQISNVSCKNETVQTYNLTVDNNHSYFAGGFLAHNKGQTCSYCSNGNAGGIVMYIASVTTGTNSFTVNWYTDSGAANVACGDFASYSTRWHYVIYVGTDYNAVSGGCGGANGNFNYRGVGGALPQGCLYSREISVGGNSYNSATAVPSMPLFPSTTYYVSVALRLDFDNNNADIHTHQFCGSANSPFSSACTISPNRATVPIGGPPVKFTTSAFTPGNTYTAPTPSVTALNWIPGWCGHTDSEGLCTYPHQGFWYVYGYHFGNPDYFGINSGDYPLIRLRQHGTNNVIYDGNIWPNNGTLNLIDPSSESGYLYWGTDYMPWSSSVTNQLSSLTPDDVTVYYPPPNSLAIPNNIDHVTFSQSPTPPPSYISVNPAPPDTSLPDSTLPYETFVTGVAATNPVTTLLAQIYGKTGATSRPALGGFCSASLSVANVQADAWWQVKDSDVQSNGDITSKVPDGKFFGLAGPGGNPGVPAYGGSTNLTNASVSQTGWLANSPWSNPKQFDFAYFSNQIPSDVTFKTITSINDTSIAVNDPTQHGYAWYKYDGAANGGLPLIVDSATHISNKRVIILVDNADLNINNPIYLADGQGFFMAIVKGNIKVDPSVGSSAIPSIEGIYVADGNFSDGTLSPSADSELWVRGSVAAYGGVYLQRDLGGTANAANPAEFFEYAPDQILLFPSVLGFRKINWKEVAP